MIKSREEKWIEFIKGCLENDRLPNFSSRKNTNESRYFLDSLRKWFPERMRKFKETFRKYKQGDPEAMGIIEELKEKYRNYEVKSLRDERVEELKNFINSHGRLPTKERDPEKSVLIGFIYSKARRRDPVISELIDKYKRIRPRSLEESLREYREWIDSHGVPPKTNSKNLEERRLAHYYYARKFKKKGLIDLSEIRSEPFIIRLGRFIEENSRLPKYTSEKTLYDNMYSDLRRKRKEVIECLRSHGYGDFVDSYYTKKTPTIPEKYLEFVKEFLETGEISNKHRSFIKGHKEKYPQIQNYTDVFQEYRKGNPEAIKIIEILKEKMYDNEN